MMYCEARTTTGLGCDSLGLEQCTNCAASIHTLLDLDLEAWARRNAAYQLGLFGPRYPVPVKTDAPMIIYRTWFYMDEELEAYNRHYRNQN
jgi:hypothetical protein